MLLMVMLTVVIITTDACMLIIGVNSFDGNTLTVDPQLYSSWHPLQDRCQNVSAAGEG